MKSKCGLNIMVRSFLRPTIKRPSNKERQMNMYNIRYNIGMGGDKAKVWHDI